VPGKDHVRAIADHQIAIDSNAPRDQSVDFPQQARRIEHHAAGDDTLDLRAEDPAGNERQLVGFPAGDHRMAGVGAPLITDHDLVFFGEQVDDFAFRFVSPLQTDHTRTRHSNPPISRGTTPARLPPTTLIRDS
jgi:hypothetical protein